GMYGERLGLDLHLVTADPGPVLNLEATVQHCHLSVSGVVAAPYAAGLGCLYEQEKELGAAVVDIGGGVTGVSVFYGGAMVDCGIIAIGSHALTQDLAKMLNVGLGDAERLKTLHGSALSCDADRRETVEVTPLCEGNMALASQPIRRARIVEIIRPRLEELWEQVADRLRACGFLGADAGTVVLTGGGAQLPGLVHFAEQVLAAPTRLGYPKPLRGLAEATSGPAFSVCVGLLAQAVHDNDDLFARPRHVLAGGGPWPARLAAWLREAF
ncbi:MAG: cell division protein FtsA, partial [Alphaproteobacteria bacterium]